MNEVPTDVHYELRDLIAQRNALKDHVDALRDMCIEQNIRIQKLEMRLAELEK